MTRSVSRSLAALGLSLVLALGTLGASTTQARADADDAARIIGGIIALYAIGRAIESHNDRRHVRPQQHHVVPRHVEPVRLIAPAQCRREFHTHSGLFRGYRYRCMQRHAQHAHLLPSSCLRQVHTDRGLRNFYAGRCLHRHGWVRG